MSIQDVEDVCMVHIYQKLRFTFCCINLNTLIPIKVEVSWYHVLIHQVFLEPQSLETRSFIVNFFTKFEGASILFSLIYTHQQI
jgi:hypothetical protein